MLSAKGAHQGITHKGIVSLGKGLLKKNAIGNEITVPLLQDIGTRDSL